MGCNQSVFQGPRFLHYGSRSSPVFTILSTDAFVWPDNSFRPCETCRDKNSYAMKRALPGSYMDSITIKKDVFS